MSDDGVHSETPVERSPVARNAAWLIGADLIGKGASFVLVIVVARGLGTHEYGEFAFALAFVPLLLQPARWGVDTTMVRNISSDPSRTSSVIFKSLVVRLSLALVASSLAVAIGSFLVTGGRARAVLAVLGIALLIDEMSTFVTGIFQAVERMRSTAQMLVVNRVLSTALAVIVVRAGGGLVAVCGTYALGSLSALICGVVMARRLIPTLNRTAIHRSDIRELLSDGTPYALASLFNGAVFRADSVLLQVMKGPIAVGMYGVAYRFFEPLLFVTWGLAGAALPRLVREREQDDVHARTFELCVAALLAFYLPLSVGAPFTAAWLVDLLFGPKYAAAHQAVTWLLAALCFYALAHLSRTACIAYDRRGRIAWVAAGALAFNLVTNVVVIPIHGFTGAAFVTFATEIVEAVGLLVLYRTAGGRLSLRGPVLVPIISTAALLLALVVLDRPGAPSLIAGGFVYAVALAVTTRIIIGRDVRAAWATPVDASSAEEAAKDVDGDGAAVAVDQTVEVEARGPVHLDDDTSGLA